MYPNRITIAVLAMLWIALCALPTFAQNSTKPVKRGLSQQILTKSLLLIITQENQKISQDRQHLQRIAEHYLHHDDISEDDFNWLKKTAEMYGLEPQQRGDNAFFTALLKRIDILPPSILMGSIFLETAWSKSAQLKLLSRCHASCPFSSPENTIIYQIKQLNTAPSYDTFRQQRALLHQQNQPITGKLLITHLRLLVSTQETFQKFKKLVSLPQFAQMDVQ